MKQRYFEDVDAELRAHEKRLYDYIQHGEGTDPFEDVEWVWRRADLLDEWNETYPFGPRKLSWWQKICYFFGL